MVVSTRTRSVLLAFRNRRSGSIAETWRVLDDAGATDPRR